MSASRAIELSVDLGDSVALAAGVAVAVCSPATSDARDACARKGPRRSRIRAAPGCACPEFDRADGGSRRARCEPIPQLRAVSRSRSPLASSSSAHRFARRLILGLQDRQCLGVRADVPTFPGDVLAKSDPSRRISCSRARRSWLQVVRSCSSRLRYSSICLCCVASSSTCRPVPVSVCRSTRCSTSATQWESCSHSARLAASASSTSRS